MAPDVSFTHGWAPSRAVGGKPQSGSVNLPPEAVAFQLGCQSHRGDSAGYSEVDLTARDVGGRCVGPGFRNASFRSQVDKRRLAQLYPRFFEYAPHQSIRVPKGVRG